MASGLVRARLARRRHLISASAHRAVPDRCKAFIRYSLFTFLTLRKCSSNFTLLWHRRRSSDFQHSARAKLLTHFFALNQLVPYGSRLPVQFERLVSNAGGESHQQSMRDGGLLAQLALTDELV